MSADRIKFCRGNFNDIDKAIEDGLINVNDIVITKDTNEIVYIQEDKTKQIISSQIKSFESKDIALLVLNTLSSTKAGQLVMIKDGFGKYIPFVVQINDNSKFTVEPVVPEVITGEIYWTKI